MTRGAVAKYTARAAEKLRRQASYVQHVQVFMEGSNRFKDDRSWHYALTVAVDRPTSDTSELIAATTRGARSLFTRLPNRPNANDPCSGLRKAGVMLLDISDVGVAQQSLFTAMPSERRERLMAPLDGVNRRFGSGTLYHAAQGIEPSWRMRRAFKSPKYTTCIRDIPVIRC
jgi:DNA polymerase V